MQPTVRLAELVSAARRPVLAAAVSTILGSYLTAAIVVLVVGAVFEARPLPVIWLALLVLARAGMAAIEPLARSRGLSIVRHRIQSTLHHHVLAVGPSIHDRRRSGDLTALATDGAERVGAMVSRFVPLLARAVAVPLGIALYLMTVDLWLGLIVLFALPAVAVALRRLEVRFREAGERLRESRDDLAADFLDALQGLVTLNLFRQAERWAAVLAERSEEVRRRTMDVLSVNQRALIWTDLVYSGVSVVGVAALAAWRLSTGAVDGSGAVVALLLAAVAIEPLVDVVSFFYVGALGLAAHRRLGEVFEIPTRPGESVPEAPGAGEVVLENVTYRHPDTTAPAVENVSLTIPRGSRVALVGPSGAGKSTLAALTLGWRRPDAGQVVVDGVDLASVSPTWVEGRIGYVGQATHVFATSLAENLRLGRPDATDEQLLAACRDAELTDLLERLPDGLDTVVGDRGFGLSGGEAQRVGLARAFLADPPLLVFDEATSRLDLETEAKILRAARRLMEGRTAIVIAHRRTTIEGCDMVVTLDGGRKVEPA